MTGETTTEPQVPFEFARPVDMAVCINHVHENRAGSLWNSLGDLETRYLAEEFVLPEEASYVFSLDSVYEAMFDPAVIGDNVAELGTEEKRTELSQAAEQAGTKWAATILAGAAEHGLVQEATSTSSEAGWEIVPNDEGVPVLSVTMQTNEGLRTQAVNLDDVHAIDPEFVKSSIRAFHQARALDDLSAAIQAASAYHEVASSDILPDFMLHLAALPPEERAIAQQEVLHLMTYMAQMDDRIGNSFYRFRDDLRLHRGGHRGEDALAHMAQCPTQPDDIHESAASMQRFYHHMSHIEVYGEPLGKLTQDQKEYIRNADTYLPNLVEADEASVRSWLAEERAWTRYMEAMRGMSDPETFLAAFQAAVPAMFQQYKGLENALGQRGQSDGMEKALVGAARDVRVFAREISAETLLIQIERNLNMVGITEQTSGVGRERMYGPFVITDSGLQSVLLQLSCKYARKNLEAELEGRSRGDSYKQQLLFQYEAIEDRLIQRHRTDITNTEARIADVDQRARHMDDVRRSLGLSDQDITWLSQIYESDKGVRRFDRVLFNAMFHVLLAERQGIIQDHSSPVVKKFASDFLRDNHGQLSPSRQQKLQELGLL